VPDPVIEKTRPRTIIKGELPSPLNPPSGCVFHPRCPKMTDACKAAVPDARNVGPEHVAACIHA
jgi:oligopeptide/dipeptide ABC transporter ATP-binding protein